MRTSTGRICVVPVRIHTRKLAHALSFPLSSHPPPLVSSPLGLCARAGCSTSIRLDELRFLVRDFFPLLMPATKSVAILAALVVVAAGCALPTVSAFAGGLSAGTLLSRAARFPGCGASPRAVCGRRNAHGGCVPRMQHEEPGTRRAALHDLMMLVAGIGGLPAVAGADACTRKECQVRAEPSQDHCPCVRSPDQC